MSRFVRMIAVSCGLALLCLGTPAASAAPYPPTTGPTLSLSTSVGPHGLKLVATGHGFGANLLVTLVFHSAPVTLGTVTADSTGSFSTTITVPSSADLGAHTVTATDSAGAEASAAFDVVADRSNGGSSGGGVLASTGAVIGKYLLLALTLLAAGILIVSVARRPHAD